VSLNPRSLTPFGTTHRVRRIPNAVDEIRAAEQITSPQLRTVLI